jgi:hypothetical protein
MDPERAKSYLTEPGKLKKERRRLKEGEMLFLYTAVRFVAFLEGSFGSEWYKTYTVASWTLMLSQLAGRGKPASFSASLKRRENASAMSEMGKSCTRSGTLFKIYYIYIYMYHISALYHVRTRSLFRRHCRTKVLDQTDARYKEEAKEGENGNDISTQKPVDSAEIGYVPFPEGQRENSTSAPQQLPNIIWRKTLRQPKFPTVKRGWKEK